MSFSLEISVTPKKTYEELGGISLSLESEKITVTYTAISLEKLENTTALVKYSMRIDGIEDTGIKQFGFEYAGGNPLDEAEAALKESLNK